MIYWKKKEEEELRRKRRRRKKETKQDKLTNTFCYSCNDCALCCRPRLLLEILSPKLVLRGRDLGTD